MINWPGVRNLALLLLCIGLGILACLYAYSFGGVVALWGALFVLAFLSRGMSYKGSNRRWRVWLNTLAWLGDK